MVLSTALFESIQGLTGNPILDQSMIFLAEYLVILVPISLIYLWFKDRETSLFTFYTTVTGIIISYGLGLLYFQENPSATYETIAAYHAENSFPSQHTTALFATALPLIYREKIKIGGLMLFAGLLTGFARIYIGEHWPVDIIGAVFAASLGLLICTYTWSYFEKIWRPILNYSRKLEALITKQFKELK